MTKILKSINHQFPNIVLSYVCSLTVRIVSLRELLHIHDIIVNFINLHDPMGLYRPCITLMIYDDTHNLLLQQSLSFPFIHFSYQMNILCSQDFCTRIITKNDGIGLIIL